MAGPELDGSDDSWVNKIIDQRNNDDEINEIYSKHDLLIECKAAAKIVEDNDLHPEVRKQYTSTNVTFPCRLFEHSYNALFVDEIWYDL